VKTTFTKSYSMDRFLNYRPDNAKEKLLNASVGNRFEKYNA